jgi:hypothetical protein
VYSVFILRKGTNQAFADGFQFDFLQANHIRVTILYGIYYFIRTLVLPYIETMHQVMFFDPSFRKNVPNQHSHCGTSAKNGVPEKGRRTNFH